LPEALPESERKLGELLTVQPALLVTHSATELASIAGSSKAAVTRFIQKLGYTSFADARREARDAQRLGMPAFQFAPSHASGPDESFADHLRRDIENLALTFERLTSGVVEPVVGRLAQARRVAVVGYRNSHSLAQYFSRQLVLLKEQVTLLPQPGQTLGEDLAGFTAEDMIVILAFRRRVPMIQQIARLARKAGIPVLILADSATPSGDLDATWRILCETRGSAQFDSYAAPMSVLNLLVSALAQQLQSQASKRLRLAEKLHDELDEL